MDNVIISAAAAANLQDAIFVDCRFSLADPAAGRQAFETNHIPGARFADLEEDLSGEILPGKTGRHPLPSVPALTKTIQRFGIKEGQTVVAYDADNGAFAARFWWLLRHLGHAQVLVLDGGFKAWLKAGLPVTAEDTDTSPSNFTAQPSLCAVVDAEDVATSDAPLFDARDEIRFRGDQEPIDPVAGHIPGAQCLPFVKNLNADGTFQSPDELRHRFLTAGVSESDTAICYCGSGVTACHNILSLVYAGFPEPKLYPGSWSEWITHPDRPIETG